MSLILFSKIGTSPFACFKTIDGIELIRRYADGNGTIFTDALSLTYTDIANLSHEIAPITSPGTGHTNTGSGTLGGDGTIGSGSGTQWYADWLSTDDTCKNDGNAPSYMVKNAAAWLFASRQDCCKSFHIL
jgi:hypothetical protein